MKRILYLVSGKNGIAGFTRRELELLTENYIEPILCFTQLKKEVIVNWHYYTFKYVDLLSALLMNCQRLVTDGTLKEALINNEIKSLLVAVCFFHKSKKYKPQFIHVQMGDHKLIIGYYLAKLHRNPLSTTIHAHELYFSEKNKTFLRYKKILNSSNRIFTISNYNKKILIEDFDLDESLIEVMYLYPSISYRTRKNIIKFLVVGNWEKKKGFEEIIDAVKKISEKEILVYVAGINVNPDVDLDLKKMVKTAGVEKKFVLLGKVSSQILDVLYNFCDIFLLPSKTDYFDNGQVKEREGIPVAIMEAMAYGMPIISTYHAGIPELINENLIEESNVEQLVDKMQDAIRNIDTWKERGKRNPEILKMKFTETNVRYLLDYFLKGTYDENII